MILKYLHYLIIVFIIKVVYNFFLWIYGYFLRAKWVKYLNTKNKSLKSYYYAINEYLGSVPCVYVSSDIFKHSNQDDVEEDFIISHGYYKYLLFQNFNPYYWIKLIIYLPENLLNFLNIRCKKRTINFITLLYWTINIIIFIYDDEIRLTLKDLIELIGNYFANK